MIGCYFQICSLFIIVADTLYFLFDHHDHDSLFVSVKVSIFIVFGRREGW